MFQLTDSEEEILRCQIGTSSLHGGKRYPTRAVTQEGIFKMLHELMNPPRVNAIGFTADFAKKSP